MRDLFALRYGVLPVIAREQAVGPMRWTCSHRFAEPFERLEVPFLGGSGAPSAAVVIGVATLSGLRGCEVRRRQRLNRFEVFACEYWGYRDDLRCRGRVVIDDDEAACVRQSDRIREGCWRDEEVHRASMGRSDGDRVEAESGPEVFNGDDVGAVSHQRRIATQGAGDPLVGPDGEDREGGVRLGAANADADLTSTTLLLLIDQTLMAAEGLSEEEAEDDEDNTKYHRSREGTPVTRSVGNHDASRSERDSDWRSPRAPLESQNHTRSRRSIDPNGPHVAIQTPTVLGAAGRRCGAALTRVVGRLLVCWLD